MNQVRRLNAGLRGQKDPIRTALREQSTHYNANTRITVYERLGLNKPGFWADHQRRKDEQEEQDEQFDMPTPQWTPPMLEYKSAEIDYNAGREKRKGITFHDSQLGGEEAAPQGNAGQGNPALTKQFKTQLNQVVANEWKSIGQAHPWLSVSSSNLIAAEKYGASFAIAQAFGQALQKDPHAMLNKVATKYYFDKANAAAVARDNQPFGSTGPTVFDQMMTALHKDKAKVKGNTKGISALDKQKTSTKQGIQMKPAQIVKGPGKPNLNVHANGYASNYPYSNFG